MKIEKLNVDKIRITLNIEDLKENHIDFHSFLTNSSESQNLFLYILDLAAEQVDFSTENYKVKIETMYLNNGSFILNVTRFKDNIYQKNSRVKVSQKNTSLDLNSSIFIFNCINDFLDFYRILKNKFDLKVLQDCKYSLYFYNNYYYMIINYSCLNSEYKKIFLNILSEYCFSNFLDKKNSFKLKLKEFGRCLKNNCIF